MEDAWRMHEGCMEDARGMDEGYMEDVKGMDGGCMKDGWMDKRIKILINECLDAFMYG